MVTKIKKKIKNLRKNFMAGPDRIRPGLLQNLIDKVAPVLKNHLSAITIVPDPGKGVCADPVNGDAILGTGGGRIPKVGTRSVS